MTNQPLVSIIIPIYNVERYIERCLDSIKDQTYTNWEAILVNDGSPDNSVSLCEPYLIDKRFKLLNKPNGGLSSARNFGLDNTARECKYIVFVDSDDSINSEYISKLVTNIDDCQLTICNFNHIHGNQPPTPAESNSNPFYVEDPFQNESFLRLLPTGLINPACNKIYLKSIIESHNLRFEHRELNEDITFNIKYLKYCSKLKLIPNALYNYHHREGSLTGSCSPKAYDNYIYLENVLRECISETNHHFISEFTFYQYYAISRKLVKVGEYKTVARYLNEPFIRQAFNTYKPVSFGDALMFNLIKHKLFRLYNLMLKLI